MKPIDITKEKVLTYLKDRGFTEAQLFGTEQEQLDPIDRHIAMRDLFTHFTDFKMTNEGLTYSDLEHKCNLTISNMRDFDQVDTLEHCVVSLKYIGYMKEWYINKEERQRFRVQRNDQEYER